HSRVSPRAVGWWLAGEQRRACIRRYARHPGVSGRAGESVADQLPGPAAGAPVASRAGGQRGGCRAWELNMSRTHETFLRLKSAESSDGERWITAWATTPDEDLEGDVVVPTGAQYTLPLPLLAYHRHDAPVGVVTEAHVSERGIRIRAKLSKGVQLADELWTLIRDGAVAAVSIGFRSLKAKP